MPSGGSFIAGVLPEDPRQLHVDGPLRLASPQFSFRWRHACGRWRQQNGDVDGVVAEADDIRLQRRLEASDQFAAECLEERDWLLCFLLEF